MTRTIRVISPGMDGKQLHEEKARLERSKGAYIQCDGHTHLGYYKKRQEDGIIREVPLRYQDDANINEAIQNANKGMMFAFRAEDYERIFGK